VIKTHTISAHERMLTPSVDPARGKRSTAFADPANESRYDELHRMMQLNSRSCILSICSFFSTVILSIALPLLITDANIYVPLVGIIGCTDVFVDGTAMIICSPQIWQSLLKRMDVAKPPQHNSLPISSSDHFNTNEPKVEAIANANISEPAVAPNGTVV
jgi:hypothetical protein